MSYLRLSITFALITGMMTTLALADTLYHQDGKTISGSIIEETNTHITIQTQEYGRLRFERKSIERLMRGGVEVSPSDLSRVTQPAESTSAPTAPPTNSFSNPFSHAATPAPAAPTANSFTTTASNSPFAMPTDNVPPPPTATTPGGSSPFVASPSEAISTSPFAPATGGGTPAIDSSASPFTNVTSPSTSPFSPPTGETASAAASPLAPSDAASGASSPFSMIGGAATTAFPAAPSGDSPVNSTAEEISLPPAFQLANAGASVAPLSMTDGGNPLSVPADFEPVIINSGQALQPSRVSRNINVPQGVPHGSDAILYGVNGDVRLHSGDNGWKIPQNNTTLNAGAEIWTGKGKAKLLTKNNTTILVPPNTNVKLDKTNTTPPALEVLMKSGHIWLQIPSATAAIPIDTPDINCTLQPGLYTIGTETGQYTRLAVFEGSAEGVNIASQQPFSLTPGQAIMGSGDIGVLCPPRQCSNEERQEFEEWDIWAFEVHIQMAQAHMFKGPDPALNESAASSGGDAQTPKNIVRLEEDHLTEIKRAFLQFCIDTGRPPTTQEGYTALIRNPGVNNWRGPYYKGPIPPKDGWGMPIRYTLKRDSGTNQLVGEILSAGPNRIYSEGRSDDVMATVPYFRYMR